MQIGQRGAPGLDVIAAPSPVLATDMRRHLVYEIEIDDSTRSHVRLDELEVRDSSSKRVLSAYHDDAITDLMAGFQTPPTRTFAPGEGDVLLLDVSLARDQRAPDASGASLRADAQRRRRSPASSDDHRRDDEGRPSRSNSPQRAAERPRSGCVQWVLQQRQRASPRAPWPPGS